MIYYSVVDKLRIYKFLWEKDNKNFIITVILFLISYNYNLKYQYYI